MSKQILTISRHWNKPEIQVWIDDTEIGVRASMDDFMTALEQEIGSVTAIFTQKAFHERLEEARQRVVEKLKEETLKIV